jgi:hypothetical protein
MFWPKRDEITGDWRRLHNRELYALYPSPNIFRVIKSRRMRWARHVVCMEERRGGQMFEVEKREEKKDHFEDLDVDGKIILKWIFKKWDGEHGLG